MSTKKTFEELCALKQSGSITWLEFACESEYSEEYSKWATENGLTENEDTAFLFFEWKETLVLDSHSPN